jgi:CheY-like chemotaxis protein
MPGQNGYDLIGHIRQFEREHGTPRPVPAVALTAYAREQDKEQALRVGFQFHLAKPVDPAVLLQAVGRLARARA